MPPSVMCSTIKAVTSVADRESGGYRPDLGQRSCSDRRNSETHVANEIKDVTALLLMFCSGLIIIAVAQTTVPGGKQPRFQGEPVVAAAEVTAPTAGQKTNRANG